MAQKVKTHTKSNVRSVIPPQSTFTLTLSRTQQGTPVIPNVQCEFNYKWSFSKNQGMAHLNSINGCTVNIDLHPLGITDVLAFMSNIPPTEVVINGQRVVLYRVVLDVVPRTGERKAEIMFNQDGSSIESTENWDSSYTTGSKN